MYHEIIKKVFMITLIIGVMNILSAQIVDPPTTFCNPLNLSYRFMSSVQAAREAADPVIVLFQDDYYLFVSKSGGYWYSNDMREWTFVIPTGLPLEDYAPAAMAIGDTLYFTAWGSPERIYSSTDPKNGIWQLAATFTRVYPDPDLFHDDDGRVYMYYGCSNNAPFLSAVELDPNNNFQEIGSPVSTINPDAAEHGWERRGDDNLMDESPWIEGCWMTKYAGKYFLQYSAPGTEFKTYADGLYISGNPLGPFEYAPYSPVSFKPTGFVTGAGHACTFRDKDGNYWRVTTMVVSVKHIFERRIGIYPAAFDADTVMHTNTVFGDYPQYLPGVKENPVSDNFTGWMLLSYKKYARVSSILPGYGVQNAVDNDIKTYWCAASGDSGEYITVDLGKTCQVHALQINLGEHKTKTSLVSGRTNPVYQQYFIHTSVDSIDWSLLVDKSSNEEDVPHDYIELAEPVSARYVKLTNVFTPGEGKFCVRDLRIFGNPDSANYKMADNVTVFRDPEDERNAIVKWDPVENSDGYIVRYGIDPDKLYNHYIVYDADSVSIHSLNKGIEYYFSVEAFDSGTDFYDGEYQEPVIPESLNSIPKGYSLLNNYPNPFNSSTRISYSLPAADFITLKIFDITGREIETLVNAFQASGEYNVNFIAKNLSTGTYFCKLQIGNNFTEIKKMNYIK
jgi:xylan 1,4-beta-xylosidase